MAKEKKKVIANVTLEQAQEAGQQFATNKTRLSKIEADINKQVDAIRAKYQEEITTLTEGIKEPMNILQAYASEQQQSWGKKKSMELLHCVIGFRTGNLQVEKPSKLTWVVILELLKKNSRSFKKFIRVKAEINKEAILAEKDNAKLLAKLKEKCSLTIGQEESFYVEAKAEQIAPEK
jgi:phage host-nuclease inhibitor protein Gam